MKRLVKNIMMLAVVAIAAVACHKDDFVTDIPQVESDMMHLRFGVVSPDMRQVSTRAVDPDGKGIQNITLFCFDDEGLFISTATARIEGNSDNDEVSLSGGIFDALVPQATRVMHLLANQNMSTFSEDTFRAKSENEVMSILEGSSGMMIYWARVAVPMELTQGKAGETDPLSVSEKIKTWLETVTDAYPIIMLRNQAKVTVEVAAESDFVVEGFAVENTQAFGTVAPYHMTFGFPSYAHGEVNTNTHSYSQLIPPFYVDKDNTLEAEGSVHWHDTHFITLPENDSKLTNVYEVVNDEEIYVFESENSSGDPVNVIIKGKRKGEEVSKYYRVTLTDENGEQVLVERNHHYKIIIEGTLDFGQNTFAEALTAPPTNNIWLSISDEVNEVQDQEFLLRVDQTSAVVGYDGTNFYKPSTETDPWELNSNKLTLYFEVEDVNTSDSNSNGIEADDLSVTWLGDYNVSATDVSSATVFNTSGEGSITIALNPLDDAQMKEGTILVKYGRLQRKIKVVTIRRQKFEPIWVSTQVYGSYDGAANSDRANVTLMFHVPESCPDELLPFEVMLSVNVLDVRSESGQTLPVIRADDPRYGADNKIGYKYVYTVTQKGTQRIYLESILNQENGASEKLKIESPYFETEEKTFTFTSSTRSITLTNATATNPTATDEAEKLWYVLVPQKAGAPVVLNLQLKDGANNTEAGKYDEFFLYSQYLDHYTDNMFSSVRDAINATTTDAWMSSNYTSGTANYFPCQFAPVDEALWGSGGRVYAFIQRPGFSSIDFSNTNNELPSNVNKGHFSVYMQTNRAKCAEVVRISSNQPSANAAFLTTIDDTNGIYTPNEDDDAYTYANKGTSESIETYGYRSFVFELANYRPYRFEASVTGAQTLNNIDHDTESTEPEAIDDVLWSYEPNQEIDIQFDITDFKAADGTEVHPFGQEFEIYIKAPMLEKSANSGLSNDKFHYDNTKECFVYKVASTRDGDNGEKSGTLPTNHDDGGRRKEGERKSLKFTTKDIVSEGQITISSNQDQVVYQSKTFNVQNAPIQGSITYTEENSTEKKQLPNKAFVSFTRVNNSSRIGAIVVSNSNGNSTFELRLRKEYEFSWQNDEVQLYYSVPQDNIEEDGKTYKVTNYYTANYSSLSALYAAMAGGTGTVNLTYAGQNKLEIK